MADEMFGYLRSFTLFVALIGSVCSSEPPRSTRVNGISSGYICDKEATITSIAKNQAANSSHSNCVKGNEYGRESEVSFVVENCNITEPTTWRRGEQVMSDCGQIPMFSPIATFYHGNNTYTTSGAECGVLLECLDNGFMMALQKCSHTPEIVVINGTAFSQNPKIYFVIA